MKKTKLLFSTTLSTIFLVLLSLFSSVKSVFAGEFEDLVGNIETPKGVDLINAEVGPDNIGILFFLSKLIQVVTVLAGIWVVGNVIFAAYIYLTGGGKADSHQKVNSLLTMSLVGLVIIISSYTIAGLIGLIFFGDAAFIINPTL